MALLSLATLNFHLTTYFAQGTDFTYQGRVNDGASPASGIYDSSGGVTVIVGPATNSPKSVSNGPFSVTLDFGTAGFTGAERRVSKHRAAGT